MVNRTDTLRLFKDMLRASQQFTNYNFREYAMRMVRERFRESRTLSSAADITQAYQEGRVNLEMLRRQGSISSMFKLPDKHAME